MKATKSASDFTRGNIAKQMITFALPMLIGSVLQQLYSIVDAIVVGRFIGGEALAAVGVSLSITVFLSAVLIGLTTGASVVISQYFGAKQPENMERAVSTSIMFFSGLSLVITALGLFFTPVILAALAVPAAVFEYALVYLRIQMAGLSFLVFFNMFTAYLRAIGNSRSPLYILIVAILLNAGLNIVFVIVLEFGIAAVSLTTVISQAVATLLCFLYIRKNVPVLQVNRLSFDKLLFKTIVKYGAPAALQLSLVSLAALIITRLINFFGAAAVAGITAATRIDAFAILPINTLSMALATFVAQNMGANIEERAKKGLKTALLLMLMFAALMSVVVIISSSWLISMFVDPTDVNRVEIVQVGTNYIRVISVFYFLFAFLFAFNGFFRGAGDAVIAMVFPVCSLTIRTVVAYLLVFKAGMGPEALAWSIPIGWALTGAASWWYYRKRLWAGKVIT